MKRVSKSLLLVALFIGMTVQAWGQSSTLGKDFWVSSSLVCSPDKATATPYIAISAEKACDITITGGLNNAINIKQKVAEGSWSEFGHNDQTENKNPNVGPINVHMDPSAWYPTNMSNANNVYTLAGQKNMYGLHITATENISVYVILASKHSMDASNILPMTALGAEYYTQDYWSKVKSDFADAVGLTTILGTEDNTKVEITPKGDTYDGHASGQTYTIDLNQGQTYYLVTKKGDRLAGTHIKAKEGRKIAVYCGVPITNVPTNIAAHDCLFEQSMPINYWGTQFIVTRSLEKNGNIIGITASLNGTELKLDGEAQGVVLEEGQTYYILLQNAGDPNGKNAGTSPIDRIITGDALYIETSCPCAVYSYDTGNSFKGGSGAEVKNGQGDPSSVWVAPLQQRINRIIFGTCYTDKTKDHFLNVVSETEKCQNTKLYAMYGKTEIDKSNLLTWTPVPGNPTYSYARAKIGDATTKDYKVFRLVNNSKFIATVYGNGEDESYAYSAGSSAVEYSVSMNGHTFSTGDVSSDLFCIGTTFNFDASEGANEITRTEWDFGDGTVESGVITSHKYNSPGWYDVKATLYGKHVCMDDVDRMLGEVNFSFLVVQPKIVPGKIGKGPCLDDPTDPRIGKNVPDTVLPANCWEDTIVNYVYWGLNTTTVDTIVRKDSYYEPLTGITYPVDPTDPKSYDVDLKMNLTAEHGIHNQYQCDSLLERHIHIRSCLDLEIYNNPEIQFACKGEDFETPYTRHKGTIADMSAVINGREVKPEAADGILVIPTADLEPGRYEAVVSVSDTTCDTTYVYPISFAVYYPKNIFKYKYNNILAVYNSANNGGYEFTAYQWYYNGTKIEGATASIYHTEDQMPPGDYYVVLTDKNGMTLPSCSQTVAARTVVPNANAMPAQKLLRNQQIYIQVGDAIYDLFGQKVQ